MLARLEVREKLNLLVVIPLVMVTLLLVPWLANGINNARTSAATAQTATLARSTSALVTELQQSRLLAVAYLGSSTLSANAFVVQLEQANDARASLADEATAARHPGLAAATDIERDLRALGATVVARNVSATDAVARFGPYIDRLVDALELTRQTTITSSDTWSLSALDALFRSDEAASQANALLLAAASSSVDRPGTLAAVTTSLTQATAAGDQFLRQADPGSRGVFTQATRGPSAAQIEQDKAQIATAKSPTLLAQLAPQAFSAVRSASSLRQMVEAGVSQNVVVSAAASAQADQYSALGLAAAALGLLVGIIALSLVVGRSVSVPLRRLTAAAGTVADLAQDELLRVADEDAQVAAAPRLVAIDVNSADEIGDLAQAFNRVQATAALLLERQVVSRRNVASMFASVGMRTSNLVGRQLALIDGLERAEESPDKLATLYRLDHVSTRLRRSASSLVVLSGSSESSGEGRPLPLADAVRSALGTVEDYQRVTIAELPEAWLSPATASDVVLLLAELIENAVLFSPPRTIVEISAAMSSDGGCVMSIVDHGMGMPAERIAEENARLLRRERLDLAPTNVLGLFVVGRIARRHRLHVRLEPAEGHGVTAVVRFPETALVAARAGGPTPLSSQPHRAPASARVGAAPPLEDAGPRRPDARLSGPDAGRAAGPALAAGLRRREPGRAWSDTGRTAPGPWPAPQQPPVPAPDQPPPPWSTPSPAVLGVPRRVPGASLSGLERTQPVPGPAESGSPTVDPDEARRQIEQVEQAVEQADTDAVLGTTAAQRETAVQAARASVPRRVPGAALDSLGRVDAVPPVAEQSTGPVDADQVRASLDDLDAAILASRGQSGTPGPARPVPLPAQSERVPPPATAAGVRLPARRVPGAALAALAGRDGVGGSGRVSSIPERPDAVRSQIDELDAADALLSGAGPGPDGAGSPTQAAAETTDETDLQRPARHRHEPDSSADDPAGGVSA